MPVRSDTPPRERHDAQVHADLVQAREREFDGKAQNQQPCRGRCDDQSERAGEHRQHQALGEGLTDQPAARGAQRAPHRDFLAPGHRPVEKQVRHVGAGDEEQKADGAEQDEQRRADFAGHRILQR